MEKHKQGSNRERKRKGRRREATRCKILSRSSALNPALHLVYLKSRDLNPQRIVNFVDSHVCRGAMRKGRSSSRALNSMLCRLSAALVASDSYISVPFVPTRLNPADDPTRSKDVRGRSGGVIDDSWSDEDLYRHLLRYPLSIGGLPIGFRLSLDFWGLRLFTFLIVPSIPSASPCSLCYLVALGRNGF